MDRTGANLAGEGRGSVSRWGNRQMGEDFADGWKIGQRGM